MLQSLGWEDPLEKGMATLYRILEWRIPWTEKPSGLYNPWDWKELDRTEQLTLSLSLPIPKDPPLNFSRNRISLLSQHSLYHAGDLIAQLFGTQILMMNYIVHSLKQTKTPKNSMFGLSKCPCECVCVYVCVCTQLCPTLCNPIDFSPPGSSVYGIFQAQMLEWVAIPFSRGSSQSRDQTCVSCTGRPILYH